MAWFYIILGNLLSLSCVLGAVFLAYHDKDGWFWLLLIAVLVSNNVSVKS